MSRGHDEAVERERGNTFVGMQSNWRQIELKIKERIYTYKKKNKQQRRKYLLLNEVMPFQLTDNKRANSNSLQYLYLQYLYLIYIHHTYAET